MADVTNDDPSTQRSAESTRIIYNHRQIPLHLSPDLKT